MEQKRTVWIALAAGIFLLVVVGAALILYAPETKKNTTALYQKDQGTVWMSPELVQNRKNEPYSQSEIKPVEKDEPKVAVDEILPSVADPAESSDPEAPHITDSMTVIATGNTNFYSVGENAAAIDLNTISAPESRSNISAKNKVAENAIRETNTVRRNVEREYIDEPETRISVSSAPKKPAVSAQTVAKAAPAPQKSAPKPAAKPATASKPAVKSAPAPKAPAQPDRFWVQAASYSAKKNADEARAVLEKNRIQCEVFTFTDAKGNLFYRVRVGPYTTKSEATYWKQKIDAIDLFAKNNSYVTNSTTSK